MERVRLVLLTRGPFGHLLPKGCTRPSLPLHHHSLPRASPQVIPKELADGSHRLLKMGAFLLGYGLMSLLAVWA